MDKIIFIILTLITLTNGYTSQQPVVNRLNYGLAFSPGPRLTLMSGRWLHLYRLKLPQFPQDPPYMTEQQLCPDEYALSLRIRAHHRTMSSNCVERTNVLTRLRYTSMEDTINQGNQPCPWELRRHSTLRTNTLHSMNPEKGTLSTKCLNNLQVFKAYISMRDEFKTKQKYRLQELMTFS